MPVDHRLGHLVPNGWVDSVSVGGYNRSRESLRSSNPWEKEAEASAHDETLSACGYDKDLSLDTRIGKVSGIGLVLSHGWVASVPPGGLASWSVASVWRMDCDHQMYGAADAHRDSAT